jgi:hypothetical protein
MSMQFTERLLVAHPSALLGALLVSLAGFGVVVVRAIARARLQDRTLLAEAEMLRRNTRRLHDAVDGALEAARRIIGEGRQCAGPARAARTMPDGAAQPTSRQRRAPRARDRTKNTPEHGINGHRCGTTAPALREPAGKRPRRHGAPSWLQELPRDVQHHLIWRKIFGTPDQTCVPVHEIHLRRVSAGSWRAGLQGGAHDVDVAG